MNVKMEHLLLDTFLLAKEVMTIIVSVNQYFAERLLILLDAEARIKIMVKENKMIAIDPCLLKTLLTHY